MKNPHPHLTLAIKLADCARAMLSDGQADYGRAEIKADGSPVTAADRACEKALRKIITVAQPTHGVWGEEFGHSEGEVTWVLDPIDGTKAFITGSPLFSSLIGLVADAQYTLGIIEFPALGMRWSGYGGKDGGCATLERGGTKRQLYPAHEQIKSLTKANIAITRPPKDIGAREALEACAQLRYGGDAYNYACVASGQLDIAIDEDLQPHDYAAVLPVLDAAGVAYADFNGNIPIFPEPSNIVVATNPTLLHDTLDFMARVRG